MGWARVTLDDVGEWKGGGTPRKSDSSYWTDGTVPWVSPKDMKRLFIDSAEDLITKVAVQESSAQLLPESSVLLVTRSGILQRTLPVAINTVPVATNQDLKALLPSEGVNAKYIAYLLKANDYTLREECSKGGTTVASIGDAIASAYLIRYRLTCKNVVPKFLLYLLMSPFGQMQLTEGSQAVAQPNINTRRLPPSRFLFRRLLNRVKLYEGWTRHWR